jgi:hypothetical protein
MFLALDEVTTEKPTFHKIVHCLFLDLDSKWGDKKYIRNFDDGSYNKAIGWSIKKHMDAYY